MASHYQCICPVLVVSYILSGKNRFYPIATCLPFIVLTFVLVIFSSTVCDGEFCNDVLFTFNVAPQNNASDASADDASASAYDTVWKQTQWWGLDAPQSEGTYEVMAIPGAIQLTDDQLSVTGNTAELVTAISGTEVLKFLQFTATAPTKPLYTGKQCSRQCFCIYVHNLILFGLHLIYCVHFF